MIIPGPGLEQSLSAVRGELTVPKDPHYYYRHRNGAWRLAGAFLGGNVAQRQSGRFISARSLVRIQSLPPIARSAGCLSVISTEGLNFTFQRLR